MNKPRKTALEMLKTRLAAWEKELAKGGAFADCAHISIQALKREIALHQSSKTN